MTKRKKRKVHSPEFKAKVGFDTARRLKAINEVSKEFGAHPVKMRQWKKAIQ